jgi:hypothetical protein
MMFVDDGPPTVTLAKTNREAKLELNCLTVAFRAAASPARHRKSDVSPSGALHVVKIEGDGHG